MEFQVLSKEQTSRYAERNAFERAKRRGEISSFGYGFLAAPAIDDSSLGLDKTMLRIKKRLDSFLFPPKYSLFSSISLNFCVNHLISHTTYLVEVEKAYLLSAFCLLREEFGNRVLLNPTRDQFVDYWQSGIIVLAPLLSKAPTSKDGSIRVEKLIVDLILPSRASWFYPSADCEMAVESLCTEFAVNFHSLFAYAERKGKAREVLQALREIRCDWLSKILDVAENKLRARAPEGCPQALSKG